MPILQCEKLSFAYPGTAHNALNELSLSIEPGEFVALVGANNAGKSSLCYALTGVIPHLYHGNMQGIIRVDGKDTADCKIADLARTVAFVMQKPEHQLSGVRFTVFEEVAFNLENQGMGRDDIRSRVTKTLRMLGLENLAQRSPHHLSGGQLQKVVLAAALAGDTPVLVLDEPTTFLDPLGALQIFELLQQLRTGGKNHRACRATAGEHRRVRGPGHCPGQGHCRAGRTFGGGPGFARHAGDRAGLDPLHQSGRTGANQTPLAR